MTKGIKQLNNFLHNSNPGTISFQMIFTFSVDFNHNLPSKPSNVIFNIEKRPNRGTARGVKVQTSLYFLHLGLNFCTKV